MSLVERLGVDFVFAVIMTITMTITTSPKKGTSRLPRKVNFGMQPYFDLIRLNVMKKIGMP